MGYLDKEQQNQYCRELSLPEFNLILWFYSKSVLWILYVTLTSEQESVNESLSEWKCGFVFPYLAYI